jgi:hypothetical protein
MYRIAILLLWSIATWSQEIVKSSQTDSLYREDQFYVGITYNTLQKKPSGLSQSSFSSGISFGFLRDFPINKKRDLAIAPGFGLSVQRYNQNMIAQEMDGQISYTIVPETEFKRNLFSFYSVDFPIEFRWRTSTPESHKFWRIYTGFKLSYVFYDNTRTIVESRKNVIHNNPDFQKWQTGVYTAFGFNTWNFYMYYGLQPLFKPTAKIGQTPLELQVINIGLQFYIL